MSVIERSGRDRIGSGTRHRHSSNEGVRSRNVVQSFRNRHRGPPHASGASYGQRTIKTATRRRLAARPRREARARKMCCGVNSGPKRSKGNRGSRLGFGSTRRTQVRHYQRGDWPAVVSSPVGLLVKPIGLSGSIGRKGHSGRKGQVLNCSRARLSLGDGRSPGHLFRLPDEACPVIAGPLGSSVSHSIHDRVLPRCTSGAGVVAGMARRHTVLP